VVVTCNDSFFGPKDNLILPGRAKTMGEGWETRRKRGPGNDWIIVRLGATGALKKIEVDTNHFKGNFPESCSIEALSFPARDLIASDFRDRKDLKWQEILPRTKLQAHHQHFFELKSAANVDYVRLNIFPDGGISRLRVHGVLNQ
ncbi:MAG: allantoicase, partial [Bdellovibrionota bacterium]